MWIRRDLRLRQQPITHELRTALSHVLGVPISLVQPLAPETSAVPVRFSVSWNDRGIPWSILIRVDSDRVQLPDEKRFAAYIAKDLKQSVVADLPEPEWADGFWLLAEYTNAGEVHLWTVPEKYDAAGETDDIDVHRENWRASDLRGSGAPSQR